MMVKPHLSRLARVALGLIVVAALAAVGQIDSSMAFDAGTVKAQTAKPSIVVARKAEIRATKTVRRTCRREARTAYGRRVCSRHKVSIAVRRLTTQKSHREVVCRATYHGDSKKWAALPPKRSSRKAHHGSTSFIVFAEYPSNAKWRDIKVALDLKCKDAAPRPQITPVAPTFTDVCGTTEDTYTIPAKRGLYYTVNGRHVSAGTYAGQGKVTILAVAKKHKVVLAGSATWHFMFTDKPCTTEVVDKAPHAKTPAAPTVSPKCGPNNDAVTLPTSKYFTYASSGWSLGDLTVVATPKPGVTVADGATTTWQLRDDATPCVEEVVPPAPTVWEKCGPNNDAVKLPSSYKFTYTASGWNNNSQTVVAVPQPGVIVAPGATTKWTFTDSSRPCDSGEVVAPPPTVTPKCGPNNDVVTLPTSPYFTYAASGWSLGDQTVIATPNPGVTVKPGSTLKWHLRDDAEPCIEEAVPPAVTSTPVCGPNNDRIIIPSSQFFTYTASGWRSNVQTVRAVPKEGVTVTPGATTEWTFRDRAVPCPTRLSITKSGPSSARADQNVRYTIWIRNTGGSTAYNVRIRDAVPAGMVLAGVPSGASMSGGAVVWNIGTMHAGWSKGVTVTMRPSTKVAQTRCNTASGSAGNAPTVSARACTRFAAVAGVATPGVTG